MVQTIPAKEYVSVTPNVLSAGGSALELNGLILTDSTRIPIGTIGEFADQAAVGSYFGLSSPEYTAAGIYMAGFDNSNVKPGNLLMAQYPTADVAAYLRGGSLVAMTLTELQAIPAGVLALTVGGSLETSASIDLSAATSFSNAATIIQAAFTTPPFSVTFDSISSAFVFTATATGAVSTITYPTVSAIATALLLQSVNGAVISQGAAAATPGAFMDSVVLQNQNWAAFATLFDPDVSGNTNKMAFAAWTNGQADRYEYACWDSDVAPTTTVPALTSTGYLIEQASYSGTVLVWGTDYKKAVFVLAYNASLDTTELNGRTTLAFRSQSGLVADVVDVTTANNLVANGYNYYGSVATANTNFVFFYPGKVSGKFQWADSYINQIWLNNAFQLAFMELLVNTKSLPYNESGDSQIKAAAMDPINAGLNFGAFRAGVTLSAAQTSEVNTAAGAKIAPALYQQGWYFQVLDAAAITRQGRGSPPCTFWYMDGESIQNINLASVLIQ